MARKFCIFRPYKPKPTDRLITKFLEPLTDCNENWHTTCIKVIGC